MVICFGFASSGSDNIHDDGIYSATILSNQIKSIGRHYVKVKASNTNRKARVLVGGNDLQGQGIF